MPEPMGKAAGLLFEGDRRYALMVRLPETLRGDVAALGAVPVGPAVGHRPRRLFG